MVGVVTHHQLIVTIAIAVVEVLVVECLGALSIEVGISFHKVTVDG